MQFRIADTFTDSLAKLTGDGQKAVKTAAFDLQMNPTDPGLELNLIGRGCDTVWTASLRPRMAATLDYEPSDSSTSSGIHASSPRIR